MKSFIQKNQFYIKLFLIFFLIYFILGSFITYYLKMTSFWDIFYEVDSPRVLWDMTSYYANHYRVYVHPFFVIFTQPFVTLFTFLLKNNLISAVLLQSLFSSGNIVLIHLILKKIMIKKQKLVLPLTILFGLSFGQLIFSTMTETFIFAQFFLLLLWYFAFLKYGKKLTLKDYGLLLLLGVGSISITLTNVVQFLIVFFLLYFFQDKKDRHFLYVFYTFLFLGIICIVIATIQNIIWLTANHFLIYWINHFIHHGTGEAEYISFAINGRTILNVLYTFIESIGILNFTNGKILYIDFESNLFFDLLSIFSFLILLFLIINYIKKHSFKDKKLYFAIVISLIFNILFHLIYGNTTAFLYICHFNFLVLFLFAFFVNDIQFDKKIVWKILSSLFILLNVLQFTRVLILIFPIFRNIEQLSIVPFIICGLSLFFLVLFSKKKFYFKMFATLILFIILIGLYIGINSYFQHKTPNFIEQYQHELEIYETELNELKKEYHISDLSWNSKKLDLYYFGMASHEKYYYQHGKLIHLASSKLVLDLDVLREIIIPQDYMVAVVDKDYNEYLIYENEEGIYIVKNGEVTPILEREEKINLPDFHEYQYPSILKVLHQEILFNIDGDTPIPNVMSYQTAWYRDSMMAAMVLEKTENINIIKPWVQSLDSIYDYSRSKEIKETDNLGELLYLIGATGLKNEKKKLIHEIVEEIENIKDGSYLCGIVDYKKMCSYPTGVALYGAQKLELDLDLKLPEIDDGYGSLLWYLDNDYSEESFKTPDFPYLNWASYHNGVKSKLYLLGENYPLTYEYQDPNYSYRTNFSSFIYPYYYLNHIDISHLWNAAEMFLFLSDLQY